MPHKPLPDTMHVPAKKKGGGRPGVKGGGPGESLHKRATDPRESRGLLLGLPTARRRGLLA